MALANTWNWQLAQGSEANAQLTFTQNGSPYDLTGLTWEYVVRDSGGAVQFSLTTTANTQGVLTVDTVAATVTVTLYAAATVSLSPGPYRHALWSDPGEPTATLWTAGAFAVVSVPQP